MGKRKKEKRRPLSLPEFAEKFGTERQCQADMFERRFGAQGEKFVCPKCGHNHGTAFWRGERKIMKCSKCHYQMSAIVGTVMEGSKTKLRKWYFALYLMTIDKRGVSSKQLERELRVTYKTAWYIHKRIREAMDQAEGKYKLEGFVALDEGFFTGRELAETVEDQAKQVGRNSPKSKVLLALSQSKQGHPLYLKCLLTPNFRAKTIAAFLEKNVAHGSTLQTDGFRAYRSQTLKKDYFHDYEIYDPANEDSRLKWLHVIISNIKAEINGTFHGLRRVDLQSYLTEYEWRFNRRHIPDLMLPKLIDSCFLTPPPRYYAKGESMG